MAKEKLPLEPSERAAHRYMCKQHSPFTGQCYKHSGFFGNTHINMGCDGKCRRMKIYDNRNGLSGEFRLRDFE